MEEAVCRNLINKARKAQRNAYAPYSKFTVGAALLAEDGTIYTGCNVENASYGLSMCAERNAIFHAAAAGCRSIRAIAIAGDSDGYTTPCGACRQVMAEFHMGDVIMVKPDDTYIVVPLKELLPYTFEL